MLLGETEGSELKPAESEPQDVSRDEAFWNVYQDLPEQPSRSKHREMDPSYERGKELQENVFLRTPSNLLNQSVMGIF